MKTPIVSTKTFVATAIGAEPLLLPDGRDARALRRIELARALAPILSVDPNAVKFELLAAYEEHLARQGAAA